MNNNLTPAALEQDPDGKLRIRLSGLLPGGATYLHPLESPDWTVESALEACTLLNLCLRSYVDEVKFGARRDDHYRKLDAAEKWASTSVPAVGV